MEEDALRQQLQSIEQERSQLAEQMTREKERSRILQEEDDRWPGCILHYPSAILGAILYLSFYSPCPSRLVPVSIRRMSLPFNSLLSCSKDHLYNSQNTFLFPCVFFNASFLCDPSFDTRLVSLVTSHALTCSCLREAPCLNHLSQETGWGANRCQNLAIFPLKQAE